MVNRATLTTVFEDLKSQCASLKKTSNLTYDRFESQGYLKELYPNQAKIILKSRCKTLDIKTHNTYKFKENTICRLCTVREETLEHVMNCGHAESLYLDTSKIDTTSENVVAKLILAANRIISFQETCNDEKKSKTIATPQPNSKCSTEPDTG